MTLREEIYGEKECPFCGTIGDSHHSAECVDTGGKGYAAQNTEHSGGPVERVAMRQWVVSVNVNGEDVVTISAHGIGGLENCHEYTDEIRECARNLLAFIGEGA